MLYIVIKNFQVPGVDALSALPVPAHQAGPGGGHHGLHQQEVSLSDPPLLIIGWNSSHLIRYGQYITNMVKVQKEDLDLHNHLVWSILLHWCQIDQFSVVLDTIVDQVGLKQLYVKLEFLTVTDLQRVRQHMIVI